MRIVFPIFFLFASLLSAEEGFYLDPVLPGQKVLKLTIFDSLTASDISDIEVDGHEIENSVFFQENDVNFPTIISDNVLDFVSMPLVKVLSFQPEKNLMVVETPETLILQVGHIISDTSFGGLSQKIIQVNEYRNNFSSFIWTLTTVPALLEELLVQCDISFISHPNMAMSLPDTQWSARAEGISSDSTPVESMIMVSLKSFNLKIQPKISGRLRINQRMIEIFSYQIHGSYSLSALASVVLPQAGIFEYTALLPHNFTYNVPIVRGLTLKLAHSSDLKLNLESPVNNFTSEITIDIHENLGIDLINLDKIWYVQTSDIALTNPNTLQQNNFNAANLPGRARLTISPSLELLWGGESGLSVTASVYSVCSKTQNYLGLINKTEFFGRETYANTVNSGDSSFALRQKYISLGKYEHVTATPPTQLMSISPVYIGADTIVLDWPHSQECEYYLIQLMTGDTVFQIDSVQAPPAVLPGLEPSAEHTFRIIPANSMGIGIPATVTYMTLKRTHPPEVPFLISPSADSSGIGSSVLMSWKATDIDSGEVLLYTLYLDTISPPSSLIFSEQSDTAYTFRSIVPGKRYYWRIIASDGKYHQQGPIWEFTSADRDKSEIDEDLYHLQPEKVMLIPKGSFKRKDGNEITVSSFYIHKYEVSQSEYEEVTKENPSFRKGKDLPVENVNWYDAMSYCKEINGRLPTEAEWELAARAGTQTQYFWEDKDIDDYAWYHQNSDNRTHPVGTKKANLWGLHDMSGNVFEWVFDWHSRYSNSQLTDPKGAAAGNTKVTRGGSWYSDASSLKSSARFKNRPGFSNFKLGFRCVFPVPADSTVE